MVTLVEAVSLGSDANVAVTVTIAGCGTPS